MCRTAGKQSLRAGLPRLAPDRKPLRAVMAVNVEVHGQLFSGTFDKRDAKDDEPRIDKTVPACLDDSHHGHFLGDFYFFALF